MQRQVCNAVARSTGFSLAPCARRLSTQANLTDAIRQRQPENQDNQLKTGETRLPRAAQLIHLKPLKRTAEFGIPSCDLQLRSYSIQPLDIFCDFALRAAYYLGLPAYGPVPLPRITERWTVPRSHFIFKKSQENFERKTLRRMIQIKDGNPETVQLWLAYLRKYQYYGVGMKANVWEFGGISESRKETELQDEQLKAIWAHVGQTKELGTSEEVVNFVDERKQEKLFDARR
ncbi:Putative Ribosomal protein S10p/S20e [[Torrubiella] hemipterigena]|uniref:Small ribosomal subunit protein uS10m n=1 Tax=[Torrubiella] hemipterigena TaxID=1531966 RepID=A0A0A1SLZ3_9HYPO|nr:Putative Ribosomal protein S10p/S20e [[Torrubiella] hemipterigena]